MHNPVLHPLRSLSPPSLFLFCITMVHSLSSAVRRGAQACAPLLAYDTGAA
jgi:hypothetical protein